MKEKVTYFNKCLHCEETTEYIARDKSFEFMSDQDIYSLIAMHKENPLQTQHCEGCGLHTLQMRTAWKY